MAKHIEDTHQAALVKWSQSIKLPALSYIEKGATVFDYLYAIPNGGKRNSREGARLKKQGVKAGVSDLHLACPLNGYHGLWIEMKKPMPEKGKKPTVSDSQIIWLKRMEKSGFAVAICYGWDEAKTTITNYITLKQAKAA